MTEDGTTKESTKKKLPTWAKVLIALVIVGIVGLTTVAIGTVFLVQKVYRDALDPAMITKAAAEIATFSEPLPKDYKYLLGFSNQALHIDLLAIDNTTGGQFLMVLKYPEKEEDATKLVDRSYESGFSTPQATAKFESVISRGEFVVGDRKMPYVLGNMTDQEGRKLQGLVGCVVKKETHEAIVLYGVQFPGKDYDMAITEGFLKTIKSL
ncbi:MAG: hypothetical protein K2X29_03660 [Candidatus Obscuribacterales bacterium]|nr:hypothetical protein [Candidatus Obscuribacterales bacterium]